jgi:hypothetical protein
MQAYGRGTFATTEANDSAMLRGAGLPFGDDDTEVEGGWHRELVWAESDGRKYLRANGRMLAKVDGAWKLRGKKLAGGRPAPFTLDPDLLFTVLGDLPAASRKVAHVEAAEVAGRKVAVLSLVLEEDSAREFAASGAVPAESGPGGVLIFGGGGDVPENDYTVYVALFVDPDSGDLLRLASKVYEKDERMGNVQIQVAGGGGDEEDEDADDDKDEADADAPLTWKRGLPNRKPAKDESVTTFRADFKQLGLAEAPALDERARALLRMR